MSITDFDRAVTSCTEKWPLNDQTEEKIASFRFICSQLKDFGPNPNPKHIQVLSEVLARRREAQNAKMPTISEVLPSLFPEQSAPLATGFKEIQAKLLAEWCGKETGRYHSDAHGAEMAADARRKATVIADKIFPESAGARAVYIEMVAAAHAAHDVIQSKGPPDNEKESYAQFVEEGKKLIEGTLPESPEKKQLMDAFDELAYEIIVPGTVFVYGKNMPLSSFINQASIAVGTDSIPSPRDAAISAAQMSAAIHDTQRCTQVENLDLTQYEIQYARIGGANNLFVQSMPENMAQKRFRGNLHLIGQNARMIVEMAKKFGDDPDIRKFGAIQEQILAGEPDPLSGCSDEDVKKIYDKLVEKFGKEEEFAQKFNPEDFKTSIQNFEQLTPGMNGVYDAKSNPDAWKNYAEDLNRFIKQSKEHPDPRKFVQDMALLGAHQVGTQELSASQEYRNYLQTHHADSEFLTNKNNNQNQQAQVLDPSGGYRAIAVDHSVDLLSMQPEALRVSVLQTPASASTENILSPDKSITFMRTMHQAPTKSVSLENENSGPSDPSRLKT